MGPFVNGRIMGSLSAGERGRPGVEATHSPNAWPETLLQPERDEHSQDRGNVSSAKNYGLC
jgi:hypothetical protein